jgi:putative aminopeptidase FrvX
LDNRTKKIVKDVLSLPTAPYHEQAVSDFIQNFAGERNLNVKVDPYGNLVVRYRKGKPSKPIALSAHMDHPGFEVITCEGRNGIARWYGARDPVHFPESRILIISNGKEIPGKTTSVLRDDNTFNFRASRPVPQQTGAYGYWNLTPVKFDGDLIYTKAADNLASCAAVLATLDRLHRSGVEADCWGVFTRAEEVGFMGAGGIVDAGTVPKQVPIIVLETSLALPGAQVGKGPVIRVGDRMSVFDPTIEFTIHATAEELQRTRKGFQFQRQLMSGGACEATLYVLHDMAVGALAFPLGGHYHNIGKKRPGLECISASDTLGMIELCTAIAANPPSGDPRSSMRKRFTSSFKARRKKLLE